MKLLDRFRREKFRQEFNSVAINNQRDSLVLPTDLITRAASVSAESLSVKDRTVSAVVASDSAVPIWDPYTFEIIDEILLPRGLEPVDKVNLLRDHDRSTVSAIQGDVHSITANDSTVEAVLQFGRELDAEAEGIWKRVEQKYLRFVSAGYAYLRSDSVEIQPGQTATIDGRTFTAGSRMLRVVRRWRMREVSLVVIPADEMARLRGANATDKKQLQNFSESSKPVLETQLTTQRNETETNQMTATATAPEPTATNPSTGALDQNNTRSDQGVAGASTATATAPAQASASVVTVDLVAAERSRQSLIRQLGHDMDPIFVERALNEGWTVENAGTQFANTRAQSRPQPLTADNRAPGGHVTDRSVSIQAMQAALMRREGVQLDSPHYASDAAQAMLSGDRCQGSWFYQANRSLAARGAMADDASRAFDSAERMRHWSMVEFARQCLTISGERVPDNPEDVFSRALTTAAWDALFTTSFNALLLAGYMEAPDPTGPMIRETEVANFLTQDRSLAGKFSGMRRDSVNGGKDIDMMNAGTMTTEKFNLERFVGRMEYDEKAFINDAFNTLDSMTIQEMGAAARRIPADLIFGILLSNPNMADGSPLFTGNNLMASSALGETTLQTAWTRMATQKQDGVNLNVFPKNLVTSASNYFTANKWLESSVVVGGSSVSPSKNSLEGLFNHIWDARIDNGVTDHLSPKLAAIAGAPTTWFVTAAGGRHTFEVAYLRGRGKAPRSISNNLTGKLGREYIVYLDVIAKALSRLGLLRADA